ncbi:hypothetical protein DL96DRAFT_1719429 [Flagelloscypha sp. PMI_526]|nr:hypothetical protein DL96DRAFT_1719429 [Flagelloscypha sp. PMI_526]
MLSQLFLVLLVFFSQLVNADVTVCRVVNQAGYCDECGNLGEPVPGTCVNAYLDDFNAYFDCVSKTDGILVCDGPDCTGDCGPPAACGPESEMPGEMCLTGWTKSIKAL